MKKNVILIQLLMSVIFIQGCMEKNIKKINCEYARKNNYPVTFTAEGKQYTGIITKIILVNPTDKNSKTEVYYTDNKADKAVNGFGIELLYPVYPPDKSIDYFAVIKNQIFIIKGISKTSQYPVLKFKSIDEYELTSTDDSKIKGYATALDIETGAITIESKLNKWSFTPDKIKEFKVFTINVKLVFRDGSQRSGVLVSDDGKKIIINTSSGKEQYDRSTILKIDYK